MYPTCSANGVSAQQLLFPLADHPRIVREKCFAMYPLLFKESLSAEPVAAYEDVRG